MIEVFFLGTGAGIPSKDRGHTTICIRYKGELILFDCGENAQRALISNKLSPMKVKHIFITHWHADHYAGLLALPQSLYLLKRTEPLYVYGPKGATKIGNLIKKIIGKVGKKDLGYELIFKEIKKNPVFDGKDFSVNFLKVKHFGPSLAYSFEEKPRRKFLEDKARQLGVFGRDRGRLQSGQFIKIGTNIVKPEHVLSEPAPGKKIVYSGDTKLLGEEFVKFAKGADLLIHESTFGKDKEEQAGEYMHSTAEGAAKIAAQAHVKKLALIHISPRYKDTRSLEKEAKEFFRNAFIPKDYDKTVV